MCTLLLARACFAGFPLVVAANRDEALRRPARGPFVWPTQPRLVAPRDEQAGGSWLGLNAAGLFVGVTNRAQFPPDPSRSSRGALVIEALAEESARALAARLADLPPRKYNAFHLVYADREDAFLTACDGATLTHRPLLPGVHVITEQSAEPRASRRQARLLSRWERDIAPAGAPDFAALQALLAEHAEGDDPRDGTCVHHDAFGYGTRSSALLALGPSFSESRFFWAEGKPCQAPFEDRQDLLSALGSG